MTVAAAAADPSEVVVPVLALVVCAVVALVAAEIVAVAMRRAARRRHRSIDLVRRVRAPLRVTFVLVSQWIGIWLSTDPARWTRIAGHSLFIALILSVAWLVGALAFVAEDAVLNRFRMDVPDNRQARRIRTQTTVARRITVVVLVTCAFAGILMTFPEARGVGASVFASAGLLSIVAGLAAQSSLANVFAGIQLAFTDAIRVDDVVIVLEEWGRIEEITLTYVVVHLWDDRRLILPSTHFTTTPFENWTRRAADLLGTVELDVDWEVPVDDLRDEMSRLLEATPLWDQRVGVLQVTDATHGLIRLRALASARDAGTLFDLRCYLREGLVGWLQDAAPQALPRTRTEAVVRLHDADAGALGRGHKPRPTWERVGTAASGGPEAVSHGRGLFSGSAGAVARSRAFTGPGESAIAEREEHAAREQAAGGDEGAGQGGDDGSAQHRP